MRLNLIINSIKFSLQYEVKMLQKVLEKGQVVQKMPEKEKVLNLTFVGFFVDTSSHSVS
jgi:hypothetical protein